MTEAQKDTKRAMAAALELIDGRDIKADWASILVTVEGLVSLMLLTLMDKDPHKAVAMMNEGLVPRIEERIAMAVAHGELG
jgi:hypothetical protein